jgi:hypothetical protein
MTEEKAPDEKTRDTSRQWQLLRDVLAFQVKLAMDGLRDVLLSPISIGTAIYGLIVHPENPGKEFNRLLNFGRQSDVWINLFGASEHYENEKTESSDAYIKKLEDLLVGEYQKGGIIKNLKESTDGIISKIQKDKGQDE